MRRRNEWTLEQWADWGNRCRTVLTQVGAGASATGDIPRCRAPMIDANVKVYNLIIEAMIKLERPLVDRFGPSELAILRYDVCRRGGAPENRHIPPRWPKPPKTMSFWAWSIEARRLRTYREGVIRLRADLGGGLLARDRSRSCCALDRAIEWTDKLCCHLCILAGRHYPGRGEDIDRLFNLDGFRAITFLPNGGIDWETEPRPPDLNRPQI